MNPNLNPNAAFAAAALEENPQNPKKLNALNTPKKTGAVNNQV